MRNIIGMAFAVIFLTFSSLCLANDEKQQSKKPDTASSASKKAGVKDSSMQKTLELTMEQLAEYNGKDGKAAYVAVDGIIYDFTDVRAWKKGKHKGRHQAGTDLTEQLKKHSPHGVKVLKKRKIVGKIVPSE